MTVILIAGCASSPPASDEETVDADGVELRVVSSHRHDLFIYVLPIGASEYRLGRVRAAGRASLIVPERFVELGAFALLAYPDGPGRGLTSREIVVEPDDVVEWRLENNLALSELRVRRP